MISADGRRIAVNARNGLIRVIGVPSPETVPDFDPGELVHALFRKYATKKEVLHYLTGAPALAPGVRNEALRLAEQTPDRKSGEQ